VNAAIATVAKSPNPKGQTRTHVNPAQSSHSRNPQTLRTETSSTLTQQTTLTAYCLCSLRILSLLESFGQFVVVP
jgi:hypothetical protein